MEPRRTQGGDLGPEATADGVVAGPVLVPAAGAGPLDGALSLARSPAFQSVLVEDCSNVQIGDNIHIHGEVTIVLPAEQLGDVLEAPSEAAGNCSRQQAAKLVQEQGSLQRSTLPVQQADFPGLVTRAEWGAWDARERDALSLPVRTVVVHHTDGPACADRQDCEKKVRASQVSDSRRVNRLQEYAMDDGWADIPYSFLVGGDGLVYEGRGWCAVGASDIGWNSEILSFALIGQFDHTSPTARQRDALLSVLGWGVSHGRIHEKYQLAGSCQLSANRTSGPGLRFMDDLVTWDHWWKYLKKPGRSCCPSSAPAALCTGLS
ncbi:Peptidoglycan-recognition protein SC2 [Frankliniella fusca]|uniref:Peptidoglycan-recognition protein SC2 n=1 Tax=Frankliniella fusca TaxID=407009 RepID=A0AAE1H1K0_9NEOP|nr:Peptidoglycan-recognition protein SC2 [Frankliniella fusca]